MKRRKERKKGKRERKNEERKKERKERQAGMISRITAVTIFELAILKKGVSCTMNTDCFIEFKKKTSQVACQSGSVECALLLADHVATKVHHSSYTSDYYSAFYLACGEGGLEMVKALLNHKAFASRITKRNKIELPQSLRRSKEGSYFTAACCEGDLETVELLTKDFRIVLDADIAVVAGNGREDVVRFLARCPRYAVTQEGLGYALIEAAHFGSLTMVEFLLGEIKEFSPEASLALKKAISAQHFEIVERLLLDPRINISGHKALREACRLRCLQKRFGCNQEVPSTDAGN